MPLSSLTCAYCGTTLRAAACRQCGRAFILTRSHLNGDHRGFADEPLQDVPADFEPPALCDYCRAREQDQTVSAVSVGMRQQTCPSCHARCLENSA